MADAFSKTEVKSANIMILHELIAEASEQGAARALSRLGLTQADALSARPRWQVTMRKREGVGPGTRLTWRRKDLAVHGVINDPREHAQIVLTCEEVR